MSEPVKMIQPKVCAVCRQVCDRKDGEYIHSLELVGKSDHVCVPVDYGQVPTVVRCDFCYRIVDHEELWTVPSQDFMAPHVNHGMIGGWACDQECAELATAHNWYALVQRHRQSPFTEVPDNPIYNKVIFDLYVTLGHNMLGDARPWQAGDEQTPEDPRSRLQ